MGGKSTVMRQAGLFVILAQVGCKVPAEGMALLSVDRLFSRMGARDNIFEGESTFFVELVETVNILKHATRRSMAIIDELGRGTSTYDGCAIASAVMKHFIKPENAMRIIFTTHYHQLTQYFLSIDRVRMFHMAMIDPEDDRPLTFLYKIAPGTCPKSHGFNAALSAGIAHEVVEHAKRAAKSIQV